LKHASITPLTHTFVCLYVCVSVCISN
jgi:hypothetical protein